MKNSEPSLKALATALDMERKGIEYYEKTIASCKNPMGVKIFTMLKKDEDIHAQMILHIYESLKGAQQWPADWKEQAVDRTDMAVLFWELADAHGPHIKVGAADLAALDVGIDLERRSVNYYTEQLLRADTPFAREFFNRLVSEEQGHFTTLADMKFFLADPAAWFREQEHTSFDGGGDGV